MKEMAGFIVAAVAAGVHVEQHHVVELQSLDLAHVGHVDAGAKGEILGAHAAQAGHLGPAQALEVAIGLLGVAGQQGHRGARLAQQEIAQGLGQKSHRRARRGKAKGLDRRARALGLGGHVDRQRAHRVAGQGQDLARGSIGDAQGLDRDGRQPQVPQHRAPVTEAIVEKQPLGRVAGQGDRRNLAEWLPCVRLARFAR